MYDADPVVRKGESLGIYVICRGATACTVTHTAKYSTSGVQWPHLITSTPWLVSKEVGESLQLILDISDIVSSH